MCKSVENQKMENISIPILPYIEDKKDNKNNNNSNFVTL